MSTRRRFIKNIGQITATGLIIPSLSFCNTETRQSKEKLGVALVGLGDYSTTILGPALKQASNCFLAGIVTGTASKAERWVTEYGLKKQNVYSYTNFNEIARNKDIDIVYIVLPNSLHAEFTIRALEAGKHVICEKPMAMNSDEARKMIAMARKVNKKLSIGYRMHYDPYFIEAKRLGQKEVLGTVNYMECALGYYSTPPPDSWKLKKEMGGGPLYNLAVYPIQSARHTKGAEPVFVTAQSSTKRKDVFKEVDEIFTWQLEFADGTLCNSYSGSAGKIDRLFAACSNGYIELDPATAYNGVSGSSTEGKFDFPHVFQQKLQIEDFVRCVVEDKESIVKGEEGLNDMLIIDAIHAALQSGQKVRIAR
jgi:glucose-fructose oxidoreductase